MAADSTPYDPDMHLRPQPFTLKDPHARGVAAADETKTALDVASAMIAASVPNGASRLPWVCLIRALPSSPPTWP
jgi:hypothetical protein